MVAPGMRIYRVRNERQASLVGPPGHAPIDPAVLFGRSAPLRLEIGCGHGEFISQMAASHPAEDFIGVEHDPLRVTKNAHKCLKEGASNVRVFGGDAVDLLRRLPDACMHRVYVLFPDPWPKPGQRRRRLMTRSTLLELARITAPGGRLIFGSDTHNYTFQVLANLTTTPGLWRDCYKPNGFRFDIPTRFPTVFERYKKEEGCTIAYLLQERTAAPAPPAIIPGGRHRRPPGT